jgi:adiponectin receptor
MNSKVYEILHRLDLSGITILIFGSAVSMVYYSFYCSIYEWYTWIILQGVSCFGTFILSMCDWFNEEKWAKVKSGIYALCGLFAGTVQINIAIEVYLDGTGINSDEIKFLIPFVWCMGMAACYLGGLVFYVWKIPERWAPGKFVGFNSHVIWHCLVLLASALHLFCILKLYEERVQVQCQAY